MLEVVEQSVKPDEVGFEKEIRSRGEFAAQLIGRAATDFSPYAAFRDGLSEDVVELSHGRT